MKNVLTIKQHRYGGKLRKPGDEYALKGHSFLLLFKALGWVIDQVVQAKETIQVPVTSIAQVVEEVVTLGAEVKDKILVADENISAPEQEPDEPDESSSIVNEATSLEVKQKRGYKRRDMSSE